MGNNFRYIKRFFVWELQVFTYILLLVAVGVPPEWTDLWTIEEPKRLNNRIGSI